jgi:hypothetical protein
MNELRNIIGTELPLDQFHLILRRAAAGVSGVSSYGAGLVTCSDERQGVLRGGFERDVAMPLISDVKNGRDRVFSVSNLCGRLEPGAFELIDDHFSRATARGPKLLLLEIASHVGRLKTDSGFVYGYVDRFGRWSPCCGALTSLLNPTNVMDTVRHPWFEQLNAFFGPVRLETLRAMPESNRMIAAAIIHSALQAESVVADVFNAPPEIPTDVLLVAGVAVNQQWADGFLPVAYHHVRVESGLPRILGGFSLRTTPESLALDLTGARIRVEGGRAMEDSPEIRRRPHGDGQDDANAAEVGAAVAAIEALAPEDRAELDSRLDEFRDQLESIRHDPATWRTYSRPVLRGLFRALCVAQPELGLAAMLYQGGAELLNTHKLQLLAHHGPRSSEGRRALHDIEAELQQLNHQDAQQVLDLLLSQKNQ